MRQRVISVPKDKEAEKALDFNIAEKEQLIELELSEEEFSFLDRNGVIDLINNKGDALIDDFEDDSVTGIRNISNVIEALNRKKKVLESSSQYQLIQNLLLLFKEALSRKTGVYFFL